MPDLMLELLNTKTDHNNDDNNKDNDYKWLYNANILGTVLNILQILTILILLEWVIYPDSPLLKLTIYCRNKHENRQITSAQ